MAQHGVAQHNTMQGESNAPHCPPPWRPNSSLPPPDNPHPLITTPTHLPTPLCVLQCPATALVQVLVSRQQCVAPVCLSCRQQVAAPQTPPCQTDRDAVVLGQCCRACIYMVRRGAAGQDSTVGCGFLASLLQKCSPPGHDCERRRHHNTVTPSTPTTHPTPPPHTHAFTHPHPSPTPLLLTKPTCLLPQSPAHPHTPIPLHHPLKPQQQPNRRPPKPHPPVCCPNDEHLPPVCESIHERQQHTHYARKYLVTATRPAYMCVVCMCVCVCGCLGGGIYKLHVIGHSCGRSERGEAYTRSNPVRYIRCVCCGMLCHAVLVVLTDRQTERS